MNRVSTSLVAAAALVSACGSTPDPWQANAVAAADAQAGVSTLIASHAVFGEACAVTAPAIELFGPGQLGALSVAAVQEVFDDPEGDCDGQAYDAAGVFYDAAGGATGIDRVSYRVLGQGGRPDVTHAVSVRVR
jgi:hypothetical protein